jgi:DNA polymerase III epsilon subunit-like protein
MKMTKHRMVFCDTETTGLSVRDHEIISICMITYEDNREVDRWSAKIHPKHIDTADPKALQINGYTEEDWAGAWKMEEAIHEIAIRLTSRRVFFCGYNPGFDMSFIRAALVQHGYHLPRLRMIDVLTLVHEHLVPCGLKSLSLDNTRIFLGLSTDQAHTALQDTLDTVRIYFLLSRSSILKRLFWRVRSLLISLIK